MNWREYAVKAPKIREFKMHRAYLGDVLPDGTRRFYTIERAGKGRFAAAAWRFDNGLFERSLDDYYEVFTSLDDAENALRRKGCSANGET